MFQRHKSTKLPAPGFESALKGEHSWKTEKLLGVFFPLTIFQDWESEANNSKQEWSSLKEYSFSLNIIVIYMGRVKRKKCLRACAKCADSHYPTYAQRLIRAFALHWNIFSSKWFCLRIAKALIRLRGCAGWSGPSLSAYAWRHGLFAWRGPCFASRYLGNMISFVCTCKMSPILSYHRVGKL